MKYTENALNILTTKSYKGVGNAWIVKNLGKNESIHEIVDMLNKSLKNTATSVEEFIDRRSRYEAVILAKMESCCDGFVALGDSDFPQHRGWVKDSARPVFLYYKGDLGLLSASQKNISVIGLLTPTMEIRRREEKMVAEFVKHGATIVSGLALGCDSIAHYQALASKGKTVAILPSPLYNILPTSNHSFAFEIVEKGGLLITEYGSDFKSPMELSARYQERDRLQALFCDAIVVAASYAKDSSALWSHLRGQKLDSGARLAMGYAKDYGIPRGVMYDESLDKENPMFDLCREIIKDSSDVTILSEINYITNAEKMISLKSSIKQPLSPDKSLFDEN